MKDLKRLLVVEVFLLVILFSGHAFADAASTDVPSWLQSVMDFVASLPYVGPVLLEVAKWAGVVAAAMTAIASGLAAVAAALTKLGKAMGFQSFVDKVEELYNKVWPYVAFLSLYNVQKPVPLQLVKSDKK